MHRTILVPLDGSTLAESALPLAVALSRRATARLHLVTVVEPVTSFARDGWDVASEQWSRAYLDGVVGRVAERAGDEVGCTLVHGHAVESLQDQVVTCGADLVIMASHGRGALSRLWLGSVTDRFVRESRGPVIVTRGDERPWAAEQLEFSFDTLLVPLDGSEVSERALVHATRFGDLCDSAFHLTRVVLPWERWTGVSARPIVAPASATPPASPTTPEPAQAIVATPRGTPATVDAEKRAASDYLEERADLLRRRGRRVTTSVAVDTQPGRGILSESDAVAADMIAMATRGGSGWKRALLGGTADKVLRGTRTPVLLLGRS